MIVEKKSFTSDSFLFERVGLSIPVTIGYETYGTLNAAKDNVVLICHFFTGTSHAAGKYNESDAAPGWWDYLIGPGKAIDTDRYFVICSDSISNINAHNPNVITTGPASINPDTGKEYGASFPVFTLKDVVRLQRELLRSLGIENLKMVGGPSMGGLQAFMWARHFPEMVEKVISVCATPVLGPFGIMVPNQLGIDAIRLDPDWRGGDYYGHKPPIQGLLLAFKILVVSTRTHKWAMENFGRRYADPSFNECPDPFTSLDGRFLVEKEVEATVTSRMQFFDPNSYMYIAKANTLFDLCEGGETPESALARINAKTLLIMDDSDLVFARADAERAASLIRDCRNFFYDSGNGHLSCIYEHSLYEGPIRHFMKSS
ncbi:MAG: homoserine O-acetyltransferase [Candidatus Xenobiia bacterium LiM19]